MARVQKLTGKTSGAEWGTQKVCVSMETQHGGEQGSGQSKPSVKAAMVGSQMSPSVVGMLAAKSKSDILHLIPRPTLGKENQS